MHNANETRELAREAIKARRESKQPKPRKDLTVDDIISLELATIRTKDTWRR